MRDWERYETRARLRYEANSKSMIVAYLLWFFLGSFGIHRMYLGRWFSGLMMLGLLAIGSLTTIILIGWLPLGVLGLWWLLDAILTFMMVESHNDALARRVS